MRVVLNWIVWGTREVAHGGCHIGQGNTMRRLLIAFMYTTLRDREISPTVLRFYHQVQLLQIRLKSSYPTLEINTIDKYQGRDKEVGAHRISSR